MKNSIETTLTDRASRYGSFSDHATISQRIKREMAKSRNWAELPDEIKESLEMIAHKIARIVNGNPNYFDSWHDIAGYATLIANDIDP